MSKKKATRLSSKQVQDIRKELRKLDGEQESIGARIGRIVSYPSSATGNVKRHRFGIALMVLAIFVMQLVFFLPDDSRRWFVAGYAFVMVVVAAWQLELAKER